MIEEVMDTHYEAINWALGELGWFRRAEGELAQALRDTAARQTAGFHAWLERELGARQWFNGDAFGWGDLSVAPFLAASAALGNAPPSDLEAGRLAGARAMARTSGRGHGGRGSRLRPRLGGCGRTRRQGVVQARIPRPSSGVDDQVRRPGHRSEGLRCRQHPIHRRILLISLLST